MAKTKSPSPDQLLSDFKTLALAQKIEVYKGVLASLKEDQQDLSDTKSTVSYDLESLNQVLADKK